MASAAASTKRSRAEFEEAKGTPTVLNLVNGDFVASSTGRTMPVIAPATNEVCSHVTLSNAADVDVAVAAAKAAFADWSGRTMKNRAAIMFKYHSLIIEHTDELAKLVVKENGKNYGEAVASVAKGNETVEWACSLPQLAQGKILEVSRGVTCVDRYDPVGVVASVCPFNFPAMVPMWTVPIALTMGNCMILKPSEKVPETINRMAELMVEAGIPKGVFQVINGQAETVNALCDHPDVGALTFVGSSKIAEIVHKRCSALSKRVLALGGAKNHLVALPDCNTEMAAQDILASFSGCAGQRCMAASALLLVGDSDAVLDRIIEKASALKPGQEKGQVGAIIDTASRDRIIGFINAAEAAGAKVLLDGRKWATEMPKGNWVGPTVILHNSRDEPGFTDEIFGPVLSVLKVPTFDAAIKIENASEYGNAASIYTSVGAHAEWFTKRFRAGMLGVNIGVPVPREPFSFGGLYGTKSKYGDCDVTGEGAMRFFSNRIKVTSKWTRPSSSVGGVDLANFDGNM